MGSDSDLPTMKDAAEILNTFHVPFEVRLVHGLKKNVSRLIGKAINVSTHIFFNPYSF